MIKKLKDVQNEAFASGFSEKEKQERTSLTPFTTSLPATTFLQDYYSRHEKLRNIKPSIIRRAWFAMSHLLLANGSKVLDIGCHRGAVTYVMAALNPHLEFVGMDINEKRVAVAQSRYQLPNLKYIHGDLSDADTFPDNSYDAVVHSYVLHEIYSKYAPNEQPVIEHLDESLRVLKEYGLLFIHSYPMPPPEEFVLLELPDQKSDGEDIENLSTADLLVYYSENVRPNHDNSHDGFLLEEIPARTPQTRLFRLPFKWAYEFIMRKDDREDFNEDLDKEFTFFTKREFRKNLRSLGARALYTTPYWNEQYIKQRFEDQFQLYTTDGRKISNPPTSFIAVSQKLANGKSLQINERRFLKDAVETIEVSAVRNDSNNKTYDIISRGIEYTEVLPFRTTADGQLFVYIHENLPRGIANYIPREGKPVDGKKWSGHMTEAIAIPTEKIAELGVPDYKDLVKFFMHETGLKVAQDATLMEGTSYLPAPDLIDERVHTRYVRVLEQNSVIHPKGVNSDIDGYSTQGCYREINAQNLLNAISVGFIPNARLEMQIHNLYEKLGLTYENWANCPLKLELETPENIGSVEKLKEQMEEKDDRFKKVKGIAGQVRAMHSLFVEEGWIDNGMKGLKSRKVEFAIAEDQIINQAVVLPLTKHAKSGKVMAGVVAEYLPVPQRYKGNGLCLNAPSYKLPASVKTMEDARHFIAEEYKVTPDKVSALGPSYFCHVGVTPMRIFPFAVAASKAGKTPFGGPVTFMPVAELYNMINMDKRHNYFSSFTLLNSMKHVNFFMCGESNVHDYDWMGLAEQAQAHETGSAIQSSIETARAGAVSILKSAQNDTDHSTREIRTAVSGHQKYEAN